MLVRSEDKANFRGEIEVAADKIWASYSMEGQVNGDAVKQADKRMFASEQEARMWLVGEAEQRGFHDFKPETRAPGDASDAHATALIRVTAGTRCDFIRWYLTD